MHNLDFRDSHCGRWGEGIPLVHTQQGKSARHPTQGMHAEEKYEASCRRDLEQNFKSSSTLAWVGQSVRVAHTESIGKCQPLRAGAWVLFRWEERWLQKSAQPMSTNMFTDWTWGRKWLQGPHQPMWSQTIMRRVTSFGAALVIPFMLCFRQLNHRM